MSREDDFNRESRNVGGIWYDYKGNKINEITGDTYDYESESCKCIKCGTKYPRTTHSCPSCLNGKPLYN